jgi:hypothetical protein
MKPWRGTVEERRGKFLRALRMLCEVYNMTDVPDLRLVLIDAGGQSNGFYSRGYHIIGLIGKMSVLTFCTNSVTPWARTSGRRAGGASTCFAVASLAVSPAADLSGTCWSAIEAETRFVRVEPLGGS